MAFGFAKSAGDRRFVERMLGDLACQLCGGGPVERSEGNCRHQIVAFELTQQSHERWVVLLLLRSHRADDQAWCVGRRSRKILQPFDGVTVGPLQIVDEEDEWSSRSECSRERLEKPEPLPALELRVGRGNVLTR